MFGLNAGGDYFKNKLFLKRKFDDDVDEYLETERRSSKRSYILETEVDTSNIVITEAAKLLISGTTSGVEDRKSPHELGNAQWWTQGYLNWDDEEFARRLRINRATFDRHGLQVRREIYLDVCSDKFANKICKQTKKCFTKIGNAL